MTMFTAPPMADPPNLAGTTPLYISMRSIISTGISFRSTKSDWSFIGVSSMKNPMRLPSSPRTDRREALPRPPVALTVTPTVLASMLCTSLTVPWSCCMLITLTGMACSRNRRAWLFSLIMTSESERASGARPMSLERLPLSVLTVFSDGRYPMN